MTSIHASETPNWNWTDDTNGENADENSAWLQPMNWKVIFGGGLGRGIIERDADDLKAQAMIRAVPQMVSALQWYADGLSDGGDHAVQALAVALAPVETSTVPEPNALTKLDKEVNWDLLHLRYYRIADRLRTTHQFGMRVDVIEGSTNPSIQIHMEDEVVGRNGITCLWDFTTVNGFWEGELRTEQDELLFTIKTGFTIDSDDTVGITTQLATAINATFRNFPMVTMNHDVENNRVVLLKWDVNRSKFVTLTLPIPPDDEDGFHYRVAEFIHTVNALAPVDE